MKLSFRQGIARYQTDVYATPVFLQKSSLNSQYVDLIVSPDPTVVAFAHKNRNYIIEEAQTVRNAWGPISNSGVTQYLYWDINPLTAVLTRGITTLPPIASTNFVGSPAVGQHWFDLSTTTMRVWESPGQWIEKIRVFAGSITSGGIIRPNPLGTQVGINGSFEGGNIVLDSFNKPLRESDGCFVTSVAQLAIISLASKKVKFEAEFQSGLALENLPAYSLVEVKPGRRLSLVRPMDWRSRIAGIVTEDLYQNEVGEIIADGLIRNEQWNFPPEAIGRPFFSGPTGAISLVPPTYGVCQIAGRIYDTDAIYMDIQMPILLVTPDEMAATPAPPPPPPPGAPVAGFSVTPVSGEAGTTEFVFTSTTTGSPDTLEWDFTGDGQYDQVGASVSYTFPVAGTFRVKLRATNGFGSSIYEQDVVVTPYVATANEINLGITLDSVVDVMTDQIFQVTLSINNSGLLTATNVQRTVAIPDVKNRAIQVSGVPSASVTRVGGITYVAFPALTNLPSNGTVAATFNLRAPNVPGNILLSASVSAAEVDVTIGDNTTSRIIEVHP